jgi:hypothetical protein
MKSTLAVLFLMASAAAAQSPTYSADVAPIMQNKCQRCHRPGDIAPFSMTNYEDTVIWAEDIARVVSGRIMPPWKPVAGHGEFRDNFGLTELERDTILNWVKSGAPQGDPAQAPAPLAPTGEWELGEPDHVVTMTEPFHVARGKDIHRCFVLPPGIDADKFLDAVQVVPGNRAVVHHVILYVDASGQAEKLDAAEEGPGYTCLGGPGFEITSLDAQSMLGGWVPGARTMRFPEGVGLFLPRDAKIVMQVHYYPGGRPGSDQTKVGLYYSKQPVAQRIRYVPVVNQTFKIPAGDSAHEVRAQLDVPFFLSGRAWQIIPHMHLLGRKIKVDLHKPDRSEEPMVRIDDWDFNWQNFYMYEKPVKIPSRSSIRLTCSFDNSADNPKNPSNPLKVVGWGEGTEDEMCLAFLGVTFDQENLLDAPGSAQRLSGTR